MIASNPDFGDGFNQSVPTNSSAGSDQANIPAAESAEEFGQIVHVLSTNQLKQLSSHPAARIFPCLATDIDRMFESLLNAGQQQPVTLYGDGREIILDGNCRVQAAMRLGIPLNAIQFDVEALKGLTLEEWVFRRNRANEGGRRLSEKQLAFVAVKATRESARREARTRKLNGIAAGEQKGEAYTHIARTFGLTPYSCRQAVKICETGNQQLEDLAYRGQLSISKAAEIARKPVAERSTAIATALAKNAAATPQIATWADALKAIKRSHRALQKPASNLASLTDQCRKYAAEHVTDLECSSQALAAAVTALTRIIESNRETS